MTFLPIDKPGVFERHPWLLIVALLIAFGVVGRIDFEVEQQAQPVYYALPCPPPTVDQYRVVIQTRKPDGGIKTRCYVEPLDSNEGPAIMLRRLLKKEAIQS